jgi:hypothetical protein
MLDGVHRYLAAKEAGLKAIAAVVEYGSTYPVQILPGEFKPIMTVLDIYSCWKELRYPQRPMLDVVLEL